MSAIDTENNVATRVYRIEVHPAEVADDPVGRSVLHEARELHLAEALREVRSARLYLIETTLSETDIDQVARELLADPVNQRPVIGSTEPADGAQLVEVHYLPGVMDPVAMSTHDAIVEMLGPRAAGCEVRTGYRYDMIGAGRDEAERIAGAMLANPVVQSVSFEPFAPEAFVKGTPYELNLTHVPIRELDDEGLMKMSREAHLFLSLEEMRCIRDYYRDADRMPTDVELETLAQTWSEHCVHKTLKSRISYTEGERRFSDAGDTGNAGSDIDWSSRPNHTVNDDGTVTIDNLLKSTIAAATFELTSDGVDWCISVFEDNAGVIAFDGTDAVTFKVETHNHPSAIEPYGGAATGIGGCIRDTMGTGLAAKPIANTDVFCVADPQWDRAKLPKGVLHPRRVLKQVVAGVRDYGNRMGIPTVNGAVWFDDRYLGNPLVFAGSVGLIPRDMAFGEVQPGDRIIVLGGRTGRDGIHGATFSSAELTDTHADEFSHAVQIGNAITEKTCLDVILQARDHASGCLYNAITDCGAGGFSSAVGEMGEKIGAYVELEKAPLKYEGLSYTEIWISEAQERMVLSVPPEKVAAVTALAEAEGVEWCDLGHFGTDDAELVLTYENTEVGRLSMKFLHEGIPQPTRQATWAGQSKIGNRKSEILDAPIDRLLVKLLSHPNIASKHWIVRQYDHEVQGGSVVKPLAGPNGDGPGDAAVLRPKLDSDRGVALSVGLCTAFGDVDPYWMTLASIDEAVRNAVCVGADPSKIAILDNFCWPSCDAPENLGSLVRAAEACYDGAKAFRTPFISGKDSLNNQFTTESGETIQIPPTLLISAMGIVHDTARCVTMDAKAAGNYLFQVGVTTNQLGGSHLQLVTGQGSTDVPRVDLAKAPAQLATVAKLIAEGLVASAHDCSDGGMLVAAAEMAFAGGLGVDLDLTAVPREGELTDLAACYAETPTRVLVEVTAEHYDAVVKALQGTGVPFGELGQFNDSTRLTARGNNGPLVDASLDDLRNAWLKPLDW